MCGQPGQVASFLEIMKENVARTRGEPEMELYELTPCYDQPNVFFLLERFRSRAGLLAHIESEHYANCQQRFDTEMGARQARRMGQPGTGGHPQVQICFYKVQPIQPAPESLPGPARTVGLLGAGLGHSQLPGSFAQGWARLGLPLRCELLDMDRSRSGALDMLNAAKTLGYTAVAVTMPAKQAVRAACDYQTPEARAVGAVNCVCFDDAGAATGHNLDWEAASEAIAERLECRGQTACVVGAGGVGRALVYSLGRLGLAEVVITDQNPAAAALLVEQMAEHVGQTKLSARAAGDLPQCDGIVNCSPVGMAGYPGMPVSEELLDRPGLKWVFEVVCYPAVTPLLSAAEERGLVTVRGDRMNLLVRRRMFALVSGVEYERAESLFD